MYEYKVVKLSAAEELEEVLNKHATDGWRCRFQYVVEGFGGFHSLILTLERELNPDTTSGPSLRPPCALVEWFRHLNSCCEDGPPSCTKVSRSSSSPSQVRLLAALHLPGARVYPPAPGSGNPHGPESTLKDRLGNVPLLQLGLLMQQLQGGSDVGHR